ncbi:hypothetical protein IT408_00360 [Candidatus Uhrbacteria bacterium]|nr:hypothetical protein [Candidatus Uhrbacteria bacterium]
MNQYICFFSFCFFFLFTACGDCALNEQETPITQRTLSQKTNFPYDSILITSKQSSLHVPKSQIPTSKTVTLDSVTEWTTDIHVSTGCESSPSHFTVTNNPHSPSECETLTAFAAMDIDGDYFDSGGWLTWTSSKPDIVKINCPQNSHGRTCWLSGYKDLFDMSDGIEPRSTITVCSDNICPFQATIPVCKKQVCMEFEAISILSISGSWTVAHDFDKEDLHFQFVQNGRDFTDEFLHLRNGSLNGVTIRFEVDDTLYQGTVLADRKTIYGSTWGITGKNFIGHWVARRE